MRTRKRIFLSPPHMGGEELKYVHEAFACNYVAPAGPQVDAFEGEFARYTGIAHAAAVSSGTAAMHLALRVLGVGPGDEVFASTLTFLGSVSPIVFQGAVPVFIDSDPATWNLDPDLLAQELARCHRAGKLPRAVVPTDLYGQCADMERILHVCGSYGIPVVADSAESLGATRVGRHAGAGARMAVFSFNGNKIITTSGGGMLASDDGELVDRARFLSQQAREAVSHYEHTTIGYNYRMSNILAAIGLGQLQALPHRVARKREIFEAYRSGLEDLPGVSFMPEAPCARSTRWLTVLLIDPARFGTDREGVRLALEAENIESRPVWKPMHLQPAFRVVGSDDSAKLPGQGAGAYPARRVGGEVSEELFQRGLCLPSGTAMTEDDLERVIAVIRRMYGG
jgi:dTDP-4-amino-4,6-dideoxygalactose transaminase